MLNLKEYLKEMMKMNKQIDAEKLINILVGKIAQLELENAKLKVLIDTEDNMLAEQKEGEMEYNLLGISGLILIILLLTWLKDGENMNPPLRRRAVIDITTICIFWVVYEFYNFSKDKAFEEEVVMVINLALLFFLARMVQLIAQLNPMIQEFVSFLKKKGINVDELDERK